MRIALLALFIGLMPGQPLKAQQVDSIAFHLYTDSLKKGTHNYINVDGLQSNGRWLPLTDKELEFRSSDCYFLGNNLVIPADFKGKKITITAILRNKTALHIERTIWIKILPDPDL
ncbi:MAG: hypothetical protein J0H92_20675 [Sphingobacteriales bacterium]|jgi:hypothetical protein|nr:hypothetical protein [Sphingobacteriales bacterium]